MVIIRSVRHFSLIFAGKAEAYQREPLTNSTLMVGFYLALPANIKIVCVDVNEVGNTLSYCDTATITAVKCFLTLDTDVMLLTYNV